jgi:predicted HAD superfamily Cof-like phosphohydrolase
MKKQLKQVIEFHDKFKQEYNTSPQLLTLRESLLRHKLMKEENTEYLQAIKDKDLVEVADALGDQLYILLGTILKHGMSEVIEEVFDRIHTSNLTKLDENGEPILREDGKIMKSELYQRVDLTSIFNND